MQLSFSLDLDLFPRRARGGDLGGTLALFVSFLLPGAPPLLLVNNNSDAFDAATVFGASAIPANPIRLLFFSESLLDSPL